MTYIAVQPADAEAGQCAASRQVCHAEWSGIALFIRPPQLEDVGWFDPRLSQ